MKKDRAQKHEKNNNNKNTLSKHAQNYVSIDFKKARKEFLCLEP